MSKAMLLRRFLAGVVGAVTLLVLGQISSLAGGTCMILCNPPVAALYGALLGAFVVGGFDGPPKAAPESPPEAT